MKRIFFLTCIFVLFSVVSIAQTYGLEEPIKPIRPIKPVFQPDWIYEVPKASNGTFRYIVEHGEASTEREAMNLAIARVYQNVANATGQAISTEEINQALQSGSSFDVIEKKMLIPIVKICDFPISKGGIYKVYVLYQAAVAGNITPIFDTYTDCFAHTKYDNQMDYYNKKEEEYKGKLEIYNKELEEYNREILRRDSIERARQDSIEQARLRAIEKARQDSIEQARLRAIEQARQDSIRKAQEEALHQQRLRDAKKQKTKDNATAFVGSVFIPGLGQMIKGHGTEGAFTLIGELGFVGAGIGTYYAAKNKLNLIQNEALDYSTYIQTKNEYNALRITSYTMYAAAGVLYAFNLYRAWCAPHKNKQYYSFYPTVIPTNDQQLALGVGMTVKF